MQSRSSALVSGHSLDPLQTPSLGMQTGSLLLLSGHQKVPRGHGEWAEITKTNLGVCKYVNSYKIRAYSCI